MLWLWLSWLMTGLLWLQRFNDDVIQWWHYNGLLLLPCFKFFHISVSHIIFFILHSYVFSVCLQLMKPLPNLAWSLQHHWRPSQDDLSHFLWSLAGQAWTHSMVWFSTKAINQGVETVAPSALPLTARWLGLPSAGTVTWCIFSTLERWAGRPVQTCMIHTSPPPLQDSDLFLGWSNVPSSWSSEPGLHQGQSWKSSNLIMPQPYVDDFMIRFWTLWADSWYFDFHTKWWCRNSWCNMIRYDAWFTVIQTWLKFNWTTYVLIFDSIHVWFSWFMTQFDVMWFGICSHVIQPKQKFDTCRQSWSPVMTASWARGRHSWSLCRTRRCHWIGDQIQHSHLPVKLIFPEAINFS